MDEKAENQPPPPGHFVREAITLRGWSATDLALIIGAQPALVKRLLNGDAVIGPEIALALSAALDTSPLYWIKKELAYREALGANATSDVRNRAELLKSLPLGDMVTRGWIPDFQSSEELRNALQEFFGVPSISELLATTGKKNYHSLADQAWICKARQLAKKQETCDFQSDQLHVCAERLRVLAGFPQDSRKLAPLFAAFGISFVVVEPLQSNEIDGLLVWRDDQHPAIAVSLRMDRIDDFWLTVCREFCRLRAITSTKRRTGVQTGLCRADSQEHKRLASDAIGILVSPELLENFMRHARPLFDKRQLISFANHVNLHPGVVVGMLHHLGELDETHYSEMLVKVRRYVVASTATDGWEQIGFPRLMGSGARQLSRTVTWSRYKAAA